MRNVACCEAGKRNSSALHRKWLIDYLEKSCGYDLAGAQNASVMVSAVVSASGTIHMLHGAVQAGAVVVLAAVVCIFHKADVLAMAGNDREAVVIWINQWRISWWDRSTATTAANKVLEDFAIVAAMQRGIRDDSVVGILIHRRLAHIEDV